MQIFMAVRGETSRGSRENSDNINFQKTKLPKLLIEMGSNKVLPFFCFSKKRQKKNTFRCQKLLSIVSLTVSVKEKKEKEKKRHKSRCWETFHFGGFSIAPNNVEWWHNNNTQQITRKITLKSTPLCFDKFVFIFCWIY